MSNTKIFSAKKFYVLTLSIHWVVVWTFLLAFSPVVATEISPIEAAEPQRIYRTPEEKREAGRSHKILNWLTISALSEAEVVDNKNRFNNGMAVTQNLDSSLQLQLGIEIVITDKVLANLVLEAETDGNHGRLEEGFISYDNEAWSVEVGRLYVPFGEYFSQFVTGPMIEFGETRANAVVVELSVYENFSVMIFGFKGELATLGEQHNEIDWGGALEWSHNNDRFKFGLGYLSDLSETTAELLDGNPAGYQSQVDGWNAYLLAGQENYSISMEVVAAASSFDELDELFDHPMAYNIEGALFINPSTQIAFRLEGSDQLADRPRRQYGISTFHRINERTSFAVDILYGTYRSGFAFDSEGNELKEDRTIALLFVLEI